MEKDRAAVKNYASAWWLEVEKLSSDNRIVSLSRIAACCITRPRLTNTQRAGPTRQINKHCRESLVSVVITRERAHFSSESVSSESWRWYLADPSSDVFLMGLAGRLVPAQASKSPATISIWEPTVVCRHPPQAGPWMTTLHPAQHFQTCRCQLRDRSVVCLVEPWLRVNCGAAGVRQCALFVPQHLEQPPCPKSNTDGWDTPARGGPPPLSRRRRC